MRATGAQTRDTILSMGRSGASVTLRGIIFFVALFWGVSAISGEVEHLGGPPVGKVFVELRSKVSSAPIQILGSVRPPTLLMNGKPLELKKIDSIPKKMSEHDELWINRKPRKTNGQIGQFFVQLTEREQAVDEIEILMRDSSGGGFFIATARLNRTVLEAPIVVQKVFNDSDQIEPLVWEIEGRLLEGAKLSVDDGEVIAVDSENVRVRIALDVGSHTLVARLEQVDGSVRNLNVPVTIVKTRYSPDKAILSLEPPNDNVPGKPWKLSRDEFSISGFTNVGATVSVDGQKIEVDGEGKFSSSARIKPDQETIAFQIRLSNGTQKAFLKDVHCEDCLDSDQETQTESRERERAHELVAFRAYFLGALQSGGKGYSGGAEWAPFFVLSPTLGLRGEVGAMLLKGVSGLFPAADAAVKLGYALSEQIELELGPGMQTWLVSGGGGTAITANLAGAYLFRRAKLKLLNGIFLGYSMALIPSNVTHEAKLGLVF